MQIHNRTDIIQSYLGLIKYFAETQELMEDKEGKEEIIENQYPVLSAEREKFYKHIKERAEKLLPQGATVTLTAAMGGSIKDVLKTVPMEDSGVIIAIDDGMFHSTSIVEDNNIKLRKGYSKSYARDYRGSNFKHTNELGLYENRGIGREQMIKWELDSLGVDPSSIQVNDIDTNVFEISFRYPEEGKQPKNLSLYYIKGTTDNLAIQNTPVVSELIQKKGIDAVVVRASENAFKAPDFAEQVVSRLNNGGIIIADTNGFTQRHETADSPDEKAKDEERFLRIQETLSEQGAKLDPVDLGSEIDQDISGGLRFGYPSSGIYNLHGSVPLVILQKHIE